MTDTGLPFAEDRLGAYRLLREPGRGGQAVVWLAEDTRLGRCVALNVLPALGPARRVLRQCADSGASRSRRP